MRLVRPGCNGAGEETSSAKGAAEDLTLLICDTCEQEEELCEDVLFATRPRDNMNTYMPNVHCGAFCRLQMTRLLNLFSFWCRSSGF